MEQYDMELCEVKVEKYSVSYIKNIKKTTEIRLKLKSKGPPRPEISLSQDCGSKKKYTRVFKYDFYTKTPWLCGCEDTNKLFCFPCLVYDGDGGDRIQSNSDSVWTDAGFDDLAHFNVRLKKHAVSQLHLLNEMLLASTGRQEIRKELDPNYRKSVREYNERVDQNRYILRRLIDCVVFCGAFQAALRGHDESLNPGVYRGLIDFVSEIDATMKQHLAGNTVFKGTSKTIQNDILDAIYEVCKKEIEMQVQQSDFLAIQADEATDCTSNQQLVFIVRYIYKGKIHERFLKFLEPDSYMAEIVADEILKELEHMKVGKDQLIGQSYDGASVMSGSANGVQNIVRITYPYAFYVHCYSHQLNLILERCSSINSVLRSFFCNLHAFPPFFTRAPKHVREIVHLKMPIAPQTKWTYSTRTVKLIHGNLEPMKECLQATMDDKRSDHGTFNQAQMLLSYLYNENFLYWLDFFAQLMPQCETLFKNLRSRSINSNSVSMGFIKFENLIEDLRDPLELDPLAEKRPRLDNIHHSILRNDVCDVVEMQIKDRFVHMDHLLASKLFDTDKFEAFNLKFPDDDFNKVVQTYGFLEKAKLKNELIVIYGRKDFHYADGAIAILQHFIELSLESVFDQSMKLLKIICTIPVTSAEGERCFSTLNKVKTFMRHSVAMSQNRLNALCMISIERALINSISDFHTKVIDVFSHQKNRRMDFIYK